MSLVDLLVTILVATILITIGIGLMTYLVYKLRYARVRDDENATGDGRYFVQYDPPEVTREAAGAGAETSAADEARGS